MVIAGLILAGTILHGLAGPISQQLSGFQPGPHSATLAQGLSFAVLGGFRSLTADFLWLEVEDRWESGDLVGTQASLRLVTTVDPRPLTFWLNGARMIAYDLSAWRVAALGRDPAVSPATLARIDAEQAQAALVWLRAAEQFHPDSAAIAVEEANIQLNRQRDVAAAAASYRRAAELPHAPYYAARLHAELLRRLGRKMEAYVWLKSVHPTLPPHYEAASAGLVLGRIRALEAELAIPADQRYRGP